MLLDVAIDPASSRPLFQQIYFAFRGAILSRKLAPGFRLPSTRLLAEQLGVSRTSALVAYEQLLAEGYIEGRPGSGTFIANDVLSEVAAATASVTNAATVAPSLSEIGKAYATFAGSLNRNSNVPFALGCCSVNAISVEAIRRTGIDLMQDFDPSNLSYGDPSGDQSLREEVANYLRVARAVRCEADQILILSGAQQAIDLSIRTLLNPGDAVWIEDPCYTATREALTAAGATLVPVPVDWEGLDVGQGRQAAPHARAVYITPSHQYPTGHTMSLQRRLDLLSWATENGAWIIEDDYDSEFRYVGRPLASLQGLDWGETVIYVGTLSKILFPGVRLGFAVVPRALVPVFRGARFLTDRHPPTLPQALVTSFIRRGYLAGHVRRMRIQYRAARDTIVDSIERAMGDLVDVDVPECGIQLPVYLKRPVSDVEVSAAAFRQGIVAKALSPHYIAAAPRFGLILGYSGFDAHQIRSGVAVLERVLRSTLASGATAP